MNETMKGGGSIPKSNNIGTAKGYVLFDVLFALFLFSLGFGVLFELTVGALSESRRATTLMEGANLAQATMDHLAVHNWSDNIADRNCIPGRAIEGTDGKFRWIICSEWHDTPQLLKVSVEVIWMERGNPYQYKLESLYAVE
ncbi:hypothetical protein [Desulfosporosinus nitroreducens]|uniref:Tfp pilus assembly protein PilV n=1 Tax=Desulfosporosinus nitroreducens TaxID=2018668 RepID=A0ABT8QNG5_9FIRM|nr:hypothetical protein [Desulfosporosinus nitroreducens]MCO1600076.1 hypothetical protein [Desulfosporosinus nitroreducens]MDO0822894.1 hypothetical protein [Desulfosporosinus nitroreducens]